MPSTEIVFVPSAIAKPNKLTMKILGVDFTFFAVSDMQKSLTFYRDLLRIPLACLVHEGTWAEFEINPGTLVLGQGYDFIQPGGGTVALAVEDVKTTLAELEQLGFLTLARHI